LPGAKRLGGAKYSRFMETKNEETPKKSLNFIETLVEQDLKEGKTMVVYRLRFPPGCPMVTCISVMPRLFALTSASHVITAVFVTFV